MTGTPSAGRQPGGGPPAVEVSPSRDAVVGDTQVQRALPQRARRSVGAWCFADHMGPLPGDATPTGIGPHPHAGLHTVTWLIEGELLHRDSLGSEQVVRPGQLNLMSAGHGVSPAEEPTGRRGGGLHGVQLWVAQPEATRHGPPAFEHHPVLPQVVVGTALATVLVGALAGATSPARRDTPLVGLDLSLRTGASEVPLEAALRARRGGGGGRSRDRRSDRGARPLAYLGPGRDEIRLSAAGPARLLLLGGEPLPPPIVVWWNFVGRSREELGEAGREWNAGSERFGTTTSRLARIPAPRPPWADPPA